jgi:hypothetical protein
MTDTIDPSGYVELHCHSCFSLLDGAASPEGLVDRACVLGQRALALTDHADLGGAVRFSGAGRLRGVETIIGAELDLMDPLTAHRSPLTSLVLLAESVAGYANISTLITRARMDCPRGEPAVPLDLLARHADGVTALTGGPRGWVPSLLAAGDDEGARRAASSLRDIYGDRLVIECWDHGLPEERELVAQLVPLVLRAGPNRHPVGGPRAVDDVDVRLEVGLVAPTSVGDGRIADRRREIDRATRSPQRHGRRPGRRHRYVSPYLRFMCVSTDLLMTFHRRRSASRARTSVSRATWASWRSSFR